MLTTALVFAIACVGFELYLVTKIPWLFHALESHKILALAFSTMLSFAVGELFGAQGVIVLMSAMFSTIVTITVYHYKLIDLFQSGVHKHYIAKVKEVVIVTWKMFVLLWKIFTAPIRFIMWCQLKYSQLKALYRIQRRRFAHK